MSQAKSNKMGVVQLTILTMVNMMSKLHNMSCPPYMGHSAAVIFHLIYLS
jgi:hypothetical protein